MSQKVRMTAFARFLIAMLIIVPLSFVASYLINGGEVPDWKQWLNMGDKKEIVVDTDTEEDVESTDNLSDTKSISITDAILADSITNLNQTILELKETIEEKDQEVIDLEKQLDLVQYLQIQIDSLKGTPSIVENEIEEGG